MKASLRALIMVAASSAFVGACADQPTVPLAESDLAFSETPADVYLLANANGDGSAFLRAVNAQLASTGVAALRADLLLAASATDPQFATEIFANDRTLTTGFRFVKNDPRREGAGLGIRQVTWAPLGLAPTGTGFIAAKPAIDASFQTWNALPCSDVSAVSGALPANVIPSAILGLGGFINNPELNDINTVGFIPGAIFNAVFGPGASQSILAVTIPFVFIDANGDPTDIDGDGNGDLAFAEIWYNSAFNWSTSGTGNNIDIETVALHENGHALGLGHFGKIAVNTSAGKLQVSPRAAMNAIVLGTLRSPLGTDNAAFCRVWASY